LAVNNRVKRRRLRADINGSARSTTAVAALNIVGLAARLAPVRVSSNIFGGAAHSAVTPRGGVSDARWPCGAWRGDNRGNVRWPWRRHRGIAGSA